MAYKVDDYVQVNERIEKFYEKYPNGRIENTVIELTDARVTVKSAAFRDAQDTLPAGEGHSFMAIPGTTNFTRGSELENTETSAVGRALAFMGFEVKKSIASAQEVQNKSAGSDPAGASGAVAGEGNEGKSSPRSGLTQKQKGLLFAKAHGAGLEGRQNNGLLLRVVGKGSSSQLNGDDLDKVLAALDDATLIAEVKAEFQP